MRKWMLAIAPVVAATSASQAAVVQFDLATEYSGASSPAGAPAWIRTTIDDGGNVGSVSVKIDAMNLVNSEFVTKFHLNINQAINLPALTTSSISKIGTFADPVISFNSNGFNSAGSRDFDMEVLFDNAPPANRFEGGEIVTFTVTGAGLTANSFNEVSSGNGSPLSVSAHVQGIGTNANFSGWITTLVPEPASLSLLALGTAMLKRRR